MELLFSYKTLISFITLTFIIITQSKYISSNQAQYESDSSFDEELLDPSQREIYRRWLSESDTSGHGDSSDSDHSTAFELSDISSYMDDIITAYDKYSDFVNYTTNHNSTHDDSDSTHDGDTDESHDSHRRRLQNNMTSILINEGEWNCTITEEMLENFEFIAEELENFTDTYCDHSGHGGHGDDHHAAGLYLVLYCAFVLFIGCCLKYLQHRFHIPIPYTVLLLIVGTILETIELAAPDAFGDLQNGFAQVR